MRGRKIAGARLPRASRRTSRNPSSRSTWSTRYEDWRALKPSRHGHGVRLPLLGDPERDDLERHAAGALGVVDGARRQIDRVASLQLHRQSSVDHEHAGALDDVRQLMAGVVVLAAVLTNGDGGGEDQRLLPAQA